MVLGRADRHPEGHRVVGGVSRAGTEHHDLCVGDLDRMRTDTKRLFDAGLALAVATWEDAQAEFDWGGHRPVRRPPDLGGPHPGDGRARSASTPTAFPLTLPSYGNMGPAAVPFTLAQHAGQPARRQDRVLLLGIGSGLNTSYAEIVW